jgi:hypothetical protein
MMTTKSGLVGILVTFLLAASLVATAEDSIVVDPDTGNYVITYQSKHAVGGLTRVVWVPATKIDPGVRWDISSHNPNVLLYRYRFENGRTSRQLLEGGRVVASAAIPNSVMAPQGWEGAVEQDPNSSSAVVSWFFRTNDIGGMKIGTVLGDYGFESPDLPGVGQVEFFGSAPAGQAFPEEGPRSSSPIRAQFDSITNNDFVARLAAIPRISVPTPYDAATVLTNIQKHLDTDLAGMKLVDPALVAQMDPWFATAIDAAKRNNTAGLRNALQELRRLLKQECADVDQEGNETDTDDKPVPPVRIAKLAARVLNFDLKYVGSRI